MEEGRGGANEIKSIDNTLSCERLIAKSTE